jgi:hypothetical protein
MNLTTLTRNTRGKGTREVSFQGIEVEIPAKEKDGTISLNKAGETVYEPVNADTLPPVEETISGILSLIPDAGEVKRVFAKAYNAVAFSLAVAATATIVEDLLSPVLAELGYTDESAISKIRRTVSFVYGMDEDKDPSTEAARKIEILRFLHAQAKR